MAHQACLRAARALRKHVGATVVITGCRTTPNFGRVGTLVAVRSATVTVAFARESLRFAAWNVQTLPTLTKGG